MRKTVLIYFPNDGAKAPRVKKQVNALQSEFNVILAHLGTGLNFNTYSGITEVQLPTKQKLNFEFHLSLPFIFRKIVSFFLRFVYLLDSIIIGTYKQNDHLKHYWNRTYHSHYKVIRKLQFDVIIGHHTESILICTKIKNNTNKPFVFNAHEFYPEQRSENEEWVNSTQKSVKYVFDQYSSNIDVIFAVGNNISQKFKNDYNIKNCVVIPNDKPFYSLSPSITKSPIKLVHHGIAQKARKIEVLISLMEYLPSDKYELNLMLNESDPKYVKELKNQATNYTNINFLPIVPMDQIIPFINRFDIGVYALSPLNFNHLNALPNKFFEFIQARLCICLTPVSEMKAIIAQHNLGVTSKEYSSKSLADSILQLSKEQIQYHKNCADQASKELNSDKTIKLIRDQISKLLSNS